MKLLSLHRFLAEVKSKRAALRTSWRRCLGNYWTRRTPADSNRSIVSNAIRRQPSLIGINLASAANVGHVSRALNVIDMRLKGRIGLRVANTHRERRRRWTEVNIVYNTITRTSLSLVRSLRDRDVACSASDLEGLNFESCVWRAVSSHHPQEVLLAQFSLYVHNSGLKPDSFHFTRTSIYNYSTNTNIIFERQLLQYKKPGIFRCLFSSLCLDMSKKVFTFVVVPLIYFWSPVKTTMNQWSMIHTAKTNIMH